MTPTARKKNLVTRFFSTLGPGLITGAADDDPSGVATYTIAGAQLGTTLLWTAFITWPLMACVQFMCARIGMVTGRGLAGALRQRIPSWMLIIAACALFAANSFRKLFSAHFLSFGFDSMKVLTLALGGVGGGGDELLAEN